MVFDKLYATFDFEKFVGQQSTCERGFQKRKDRQTKQCKKLINKVGWTQ
jgi:hypothetical protein